MENTATATTPTDAPTPTGTEAMFIALNFVDYCDARPGYPLSAATVEFAAQAGLTTAQLRAVVDGARAQLAAVAAVEAFG